MKKITESFLPFLLLLLGIFATVIFMDGYAEDTTQNVELIYINPKSDVFNEKLLDFETEETEKSVLNKAVLNDVQYKTAVELYKARKYQKSKANFISLDLKYSDNIIIKNYLGLNSLKLNEYLKAELYFKNGIQIDSSHVGSMLNLGIVYTKLRQFKNAESIYLKSQVKQPKHSKSYLNLGMLFFKQELWQRAIPQFEKTIQYSSGSIKAKAFCYLGITQLELGDTVNSQFNLNEAINHKPNYELARIYLSTTFAEQSKKEEELLKIYQLDPNSFNANMHLGMFYETENRIQETEQHYKEAIKINSDNEQIIEKYTGFLIAQSRFDEAETILRGLSSVDTLPQSFYYKAKIASNKGDLSESIKNYDKAIQKSKNNYPEAYVNKAILNKKNGQNIKAINNYKKAIKYRVEYPLAYYNLGLLYSEMDSNKAAIRYYKLALKYDANSFKSWYNLGSIYKKQKKYKNAIKAFEKSNQINPQYLKGMSALASVYSNSGKSKQAIQQYQILLKQYPNYSKGWYNLGLLLRNKRQYEEAIKAYQRVIALDPNHIKARINIGALYARDDNVNMAIKSFEEAADIDINNAEIRYNLALQYEKKKQYSKAINQFSKTIQVDKKYLKAYDKLINLYSNQKDSVNSTIILYRKLLLKPSGDTLYKIGKILHQQKQYKLAINAYRTADKNGAKTHWCDYWTGKAYMDQKQYSKAESFFKKALKLRKDHKFSWYRMGQIKEIAGDQKSADTYYQKLLKADPKFKIVHKSKL